MRKSYIPISRFATHREKETHQAVIEQKPQELDRKAGNILHVSIVSARAFVDFIDETHDTLSLDISMSGKRFTSQKCAATVEPSLKFDFSIKLSQTFQEIFAKGKASICVLKNGMIYGCSGPFEWRRSLCGFLRIPVQIHSSSEEPCGLLDISFEISNPMIDPASLDEKINSEGIGKNHICNLTSRLIPTPFHAFRFCHAMNMRSRLLNLSLEDGLFSLHSLLSQKGGSQEQICILLCSFLSGFGMNAFISEGLVFTFESDAVTKWDISSGKTEKMEDFFGRPLCGPNKSFAPLCEKPGIVLTDQTKWKSIDSPPPISPPSLSLCHGIDQELLSAKLKKMIAEFRKPKMTKFLSKVERLLNPIAYSFEASKLGSSDPLTKAHIAETLSLILPKKTSYISKSFCAFSDDPQDVFIALQTKAGSILASSRTDSFAISVSASYYAEGVGVCWVLFGEITADTE